MTEQDNTQLFSAYDDAAKTNALIAYALMALGLFTGILWIAGAIWAMVKKDDAKDSIFADHYNNITSLFWWGMLWTVIGIILSFIGVGLIVIFVVWIWCVYRLVKGFAAITSNKPYNS